MKINLIFYFLVFAVYVFPQQYLSKDGIIKDSAYTVFGYYQKELKKFPFIKIAKAEHTPLVNEEYNLIYSSIGKRNLHLDLFYPSQTNSQKLPIAILIHGGGWRSGDKSFQHPLAIKLAEKGFLCATVEYRLSPEAKYPASIIDIKNAIKWLKCNTASYNSDTTKVALMGCSSGGHLAVLTGVTKNVEKFNTGESKHNSTSDVQVIIDIDGILDFTDPAESGKDTSELFPSVGKLWLGETYKNKPSLWIEASPITYISKDSPPILFINSSIDRFHAGRDKAIAILSNYSIKSEVCTLVNTPHTFWLFHPWFSQTIDIINNFLQIVFDF